MGHNGGLQPRSNVPNARLRKLPIRLTLLPEVALTISAAERTALEQNNLFHLECSRLKPRFELKRDDFLDVFTKGINPVTISRVHCIIECVDDSDGNGLAAYVTDTSKFGIRIDGQLIGLFAARNT